MAHACSGKAGPGGIRHGPLPGFFPGRDGTVAVEAGWKEEASELPDGIRTALAGEFGENLGNVRGQERIRSMSLQGGRNFGKPDRESRARLGREFRKHLHRWLNAGTGMPAVGDDGDDGGAADISGNLLPTIPLNPKSLSAYQARALAGLGNAAFAAETRTRPGHISRRRCNCSGAPLLRAFSEE
jgi:hypothetical protein